MKSAQDWLKELPDHSDPNAKAVLLNEIRDIQMDALEWALSMGCGQAQRLKRKIEDLRYEILYPQK